MTPKQIISLIEVPFRLLDDVIEAGDFSFELAVKAVYKLWRVTVVTVKAPYLAVTGLFRQPEPACQALKARQIDHVPDQPFEQVPADDADDQDELLLDNNDSALESDSEPDSEHEDDAEFEAFKTTCQERVRSLSEIGGATGMSAQEPLVLTDSDRHHLIHSLGVTEGQLKDELAGYNQAHKAEREASLQASGQEESAVIDDELSQDAIVSVMKATSQDADDSDQEAENLTQLARNARKSAVKNKSGLARMLDLERKNSPLKALLAKKTSIAREEYQDIASAMAQNLQGQKCNEKQLAEYLNTTLLTYQSRVHRLVPAVAAYLNQQGVNLSQPLTVKGLQGALTSPHLDQGDKNLLRLFFHLCENLHEQVYAPVQVNDYFNQLTQLNRLLTRITGLRKSCGDDYELARSMAADLDIMDKVLRARLELVQTMRASDQRTYALTLAQAEAWENDALQTLEQLSLEFEQSLTQQTGSMNKVKKGIHERRADKERQKFILAKNQINAIKTQLRTLLEERLKKYRELVYTYEDRELSQDELDRADIPDMVGIIDVHVKALTAVVDAFQGGGKRLNKTVIDRLENRCPQGVSEVKVPLVVDGELHTFQVRYTPAKDFQLPLTEDGQTLADPVGFQGRFPCSANRNSADAQNLVVVEVFDETGEPVRREVRVGTLIPYQIKKDGERGNIARNRRDQALTMLMAANHDRIEGLHGVLQDALDPKTAAEQVPVELPFTYICYLSPDQLRRTGILENEHQMVRESKALLDELQDQVKVLAVHTPEGPRYVPVQARPTMFVFPVNMLGFSPKYRASCQTYMLADQINDQALVSLIGTGNDPQGVPGGEVGKFLSDGEGQYLNPQQREDLIALCNELRTVIGQRLYHNGGKRPFYPSWLVEQITERLHHSLLDGCKSAKDRTNNAGKSHLVDTAAAYVRAQRPSQDSASQRLALGKDLVTTEMMENQTTAHLVCGALEQQRANCGKAGYKVDITAQGLVNGAVYRRLTAS